MKTKISRETMERFQAESRRIEGMSEIVPSHELDACLDFINDDHCNPSSVLALLAIVQPDAQLRERDGMNVRVGNHFPPVGGQRIKSSFESTISAISLGDIEPFRLHRAFESLHPFTDGNGRIGRLLWLWQMVHHLDYDGSLLFLHKWYYQSLSS